MNVQKAKLQGLNFTGIYNSFKDETKKQIAEERKTRPNARIVMVKHKHSGYSAYADDKYFAYETIERTNQIIKNHKNKLIQLKSEYEEKVAKANKKYIEAEKRNLEAKNKLEQ